MYEKIYNKPDIYKIYVPLPNNPLKNLNCYVIKTPEKNLIIDTGFNMPECLAALKEGLEELEINIDKTEMFLTHLHADHTGLVKEIMNDDSKIYISKTDYDFLSMDMTKYWERLEQKFRSQGFPDAEILVQRYKNPSKIYAPKSNFNAVTFEDQYKFNIGEYEFTCVLTPGHTPGHSCLYLEKEKIMFLGDHVLFDITPNITAWEGVKNSLDDYLESLNKIRQYTIKTALPAHRNNAMNLHDRIEQLLHHHELRLQNLINIVTEFPGMNSYNIASKMQWSMRGKDWSEFPVQQKWFAVGETLSHLNYLIEDNKIYSECINGIYVYNIKK